MRDALEFAVLYWVYTACLMALVQNLHAVLLDFITMFNHI